MIAAISKTITVTFGWWILPAVITLICALSIWKVWANQTNTSSGWFDGVAETIITIILAVPPLVAWLIYFIIF